MQQVKIELDRQLAIIDTQLEDAEGETKAKLNDAKIKLESEGEKLAARMKQLGERVNDGWDEFRADSKQLARNMENSIMALSVKDDVES